MRSQTADKILNDLRSRKTPYFVECLGFMIRVDKYVYPPRQDSFFLADNLKDLRFGVRSGERVLDYGVGSGILSLVAASCGGNVLGVDINKSAVECARHNAIMNSLSHSVEIRHGCFDAIVDKEEFDVVAANLPFENSTPRDLLEYSVYDPDFKMRRDLFDYIKGHLTLNGRIFFTYSERVQKIKPLENFAKGFKIQIIDRRIIDGEVYFIYLIK